MMIFDANGKSVQDGHSVDSDILVSKCPTCGAMFVADKRVNADKVKERKCPTCGTVLGTW